jgi:hypothetical protein
VAVSVEFTVYAVRAKMPSPVRWAKAVREAGFPADLHADFDVETFSGFLPCKYDGKPGGFEYIAGKVTNDDRANLGVAAEYDFAVTFATHSDMRELATSVIAAAVLCDLVGGRLSDLQAGEDVAASQALTWAREMLDQIRGDLEG